VRVVVIGAGISGLATAFRIRRAFEADGLALDLQVLEAAPEVGGTVATHVEDGFRIEAGPNGFLDGKPGTLNLVRDTGLEERLLPADHAAKKRFLYVGGRLEPLPGSPGAFLKSRVLPFGARLRVFLEPVRPRGPEDETVAEFGRRRLGKSAVDRLLDPMVSGIFGGDVEALSVAAAFPAVKALEREHGSLVRGMMARRRARRRAGAPGGAGGPSGPAGHLHSLKGGMGELTQALARHLGNAVRTGVAVTSVRARFGGGFTIHLDGGETLEADVVVSAAPAYAAATYLGDFATIAKELSAIPYASLSVVAVGLRETDLPRPLDGFGFLVPSGEGESILGCLFSSSIYPGHRAPPGHVLIRTMVGGARRPDLAMLPEDALVEVVRAAHRKILGIDWERPALLRISRYPRAIPQYPVGHLERVARIEAACLRQPGLFVTGNHQRGVGLNDCAADAERVAEAVRALAGAG
jgi:protoporphyrinogen/coproporphyrinogen III oxidase